MSRIEYLTRALIQHNDQFLVCRDMKNGHAYLPGGHIEFGESAETALIRELKEEAGLDIRPLAPLLVWEARFTQSGKPKHELTVVFHVEHRSGTAWPAVISSLESHITFEWIPFSAVDSARVVPGQLVDWLLSKPTAQTLFQWLSIDENQ